MLFQNVLDWSTAAITESVCVVSCYFIRTKTRWDTVYNKCFFQCHLVCHWTGFFPQKWLNYGTRVVCGTVKTHSSKEKDMRRWRRQRGWRGRAMETEGKQGVNRREMESSWWRAPVWCVKSLFLCWYVIPFTSRTWDCSTPAFSPLDNKTCLPVSSGPKMTKSLFLLGRYCLVCAHSWTGLMKSWDKCIKFYKNVKLSISLFCPLSLFACLSAWFLWTTHCTFQNLSSLLHALQGSINITWQQSSDCDWSADSVWRCKNAVTPTSGGLQVCTTEVSFELPQTATGDHPESLLGGDLDPHQRQQPLARTSGEGAAAPLIHKTGHKNTLCQQWWGKHLPQYGFL